MARVEAVLGAKPLPAFFSGHGPDGEAVRARGRSRLALAYDPARSRLIVVAPHVLDKRDPTQEEMGYLATLDEAILGMRELGGGLAGRLVLRRTWIDVDTDLLTAPSWSWA